MTACSSAAELLAGLVKGPDGIYTMPHGNADQENERKVRSEVAAKIYDDHLAEIARHHSIPVMDREVDLFVRGIPQGGLIIDVGGCWGWHWRRLKHVRPDIRVVVVDFVRANLFHAQTVLKDDIDSRVFLVEGDAANLQFPDNAFDGYWTVQTLQHVPDFKKAVAEAARVVKPGGQFACYSLNDPLLIRWVYKLFGKYWHRSGVIPGGFRLERMNARQVDAAEQAFGAPARQRFTEILFTPDFGFRPGSRAGWVGALDAALSGGGLQSLIARQHSLHLRKPER